MKKKILSFVVLASLVASMPSTSVAANKDPGGFKGFLTGCCFGLRVGSDYNELGTGNRDFFSWFLVGCCMGPRTAMDYRDGKEIYILRDVGPVIPYIGVIFRVWDGIDTANGKTRADLIKAYGAAYY